jgi:hypothetical protein
LSQADCLDLSYAADKPAKPSPQPKAEQHAHAPEVSCHCHQQLAAIITTTVTLSPELLSIKSTYHKELSILEVANIVQLFNICRVQ